MYWPHPTDLTDEQVTRAYTVITQMLAEKCPELNAERGVVGNLVTELHAMLQASSMAAIEKLRHSLCARDVALDPDNALPAAVDKLAANFNVTRRISTKARGKVTVVRKRPLPWSLGPNTKFRARGQFFNVDGTFSVRGTGAAVRPGRNLAVREVAYGNGVAYAVDIPVVAQEVHTDTDLKHFDIVTPVIPPNGFINAYAAEDFVGGHGPQTNAELVKRFYTGMALPSFSGIENIKALVRQSGLEIADIAVIGARNKEMTRDHHDGISSGNTLDIYIRSFPFPCTRCCHADARFINREDGYNIWEAEFPASDVAGIYAITCTDNSEIIAEEYDSAVPHLDTAAARYSSYQKARVRFKNQLETYGMTPGESVQTFSFWLQGDPSVAKLQAYLDSPEVMQPGLRVLVKAATPVWVTVEFELERCDGDEHEWINAVKNYVQNLPIGEAPNKFQLVKAMPQPDAVADVQITQSREFDATCAAFVRDSTTVIQVKE